jgi:hypothetical protein
VLEFVHVERRLADRAGNGNRVPALDALDLPLGMLQDLLRHCGVYDVEESRVAPVHTVQEATKLGGSPLLGAESEALAGRDPTELARSGP